MLVNKVFRTSNLEVNRNSSFYAYVVLDQISHEYERVVYTFIDMFGFLGGLFDFMFFVGLISIQFLTENMYFNKTLSRLYHTRDANEHILHHQTLQTRTSNKLIGFSKPKEQPSKDPNQSEIHSEINFNKPDNVNSKHTYKMQSDCKNEMLENSFSRF